MTISTIICPICCKTCFFIALQIAEICSCSARHYFHDGQLDSTYYYFLYQDLKYEFAMDAESLSLVCVSSSHVDVIFEEISPSDFPIWDSEVKLEEICIAQIERHKKLQVFA